MRYKLIGIILVLPQLKKGFSKVTALTFVEGHFIKYKNVIKAPMPCAIIYIGTS